MARSSQKFIARNRAPRVQIAYELDVYGTQRQIELPFVIGVLADLSGQAGKVLPPVSDRKFREIDADNFDDVMESIKPRVAFEVPDTSGKKGKLEVDLEFTSIDDFSPQHVASQVPTLAAMLTARQQLHTLLTYMDGKAGAEKSLDAAIEDPSLLSALASGQERVTTEDGEDFANFLNQQFRPGSDQAGALLLITMRVLASFLLSAPQLATTGSIAAIMAIVADIDRRLSEQINIIIHHPDFQELEGSWRGLHFLVGNVESSSRLKIRVLDISKPELGRTLKKYRGSSWEHGPVFRKIYDEVFGQLGGEPFGCLVGDYYFGPGPADVAMLGELAKFGAVAHTPFITGASPALMGMENWQEISNPRDLAAVFSTPDYAAWRSLRESEDSRYIGMTMPRFLARQPYGDDSNPVDGFRFEEENLPGKPDSFTWCNSAYGMASNIARSFAEYGWCSRIRGIESGGILEGLPTYTFPSDDGGVEMRASTEVSLSDRWESELSRSGLMPLLHRKNSDVSVFISAQPIHKSPEYDDPDITANAAIAARFPYLLSCCRFAHYIKAIVRDTVGVSQDRAQIEAALNDWINQYVDPDPNLSSETAKARKPLADGQVVVDEDEDDPFRYTAKLYIRPHYQLEGLTVSIRLVIKLEHAA